MPEHTASHGSARAQTFLSRVRDGWGHLTLSLCCPLTSSHPAPWQPHHRSLREPRNTLGGQGHRPGMPWGPTGTLSQSGPDSWPQESFALVDHVSGPSLPLLLWPLMLIQP